MFILSETTWDRTYLAELYQGSFICPAANSSAFNE
jgi:hypothetical protein